jgi:thiol-disulfide isomerase/thioredoxin
VIAAALSIGLTVGGDDSPAIATETSFAEAIGDPLILFDHQRMPTVGDPSEGSPAPRVSAQTLSGERVQLGGDGVARLYGFFAHWCPHCRAELPRTVEWLADNEIPNGVEFTVISTGVDSTAPNYPPSEWFEREGFPLDVVLDSQTDTLNNAFGLSSFPFWVAVDADGNVAKRAAGELTEAEFEALLGLITPEA